MKELFTTLNDLTFDGVIQIHQNDQLVFQRACGLRNRSEQLENNIETKFGIASGTKFFTALGILKLVDDHKLSLDTPVFDILKKPFSTYDSRVTIEDLLRHRSGLPDYYDEDFIKDFDNFKVAVPWHELRKPSDYMAVMPDRTMKYPVNTTFHYNNSGYVLLAMVIEILTGDYHEYLHQVLKSIHVHNTGFYFFDHLPSNTAIGYIETENSYRSNIYTLPIVGGGDGGIFTCAKDIFNIWQAFLKGEIVSQHLVDQALRSPFEDPYGFGLWLTKYDETYQPSISGMDAGVSFVSVYRRDLNLSYTILSNNDHDAFKISNIIRDFKKNTTD